ncbi:MAG: DUF983 domain-containing protein, partial [Opitutaceae bacterium]
VRRPRPTKDRKPIHDPIMKVTQTQIISRGLANRCPNCGGATLFPPPPSLRVNPQCADCGMKFDRGDGFFLGPFVLNYTVTVVCFLIPVILLGVAGVIGRTAMIVGILFGSLVIPALLYRRSWGWWLTTYFYFLPQKLPNNREATGEDEED